VDVILVREGDALQVEVRDDGRGFTADAQAGPAHGAGLASMRLRARRLGGQLELASSPSGTLLRCRLPLAP
jgi:signal transduction histidine kinase